MKRKISNIFKAGTNLLKRLKKPTQKIRPYKIKKRESSSVVKEKLGKVKNGEEVSIVVGTQFTKFNQNATLITGQLIGVNTETAYFSVKGRKTSVPLKDIWQIK